jgi:hypothetical protein
MVHHENGGYKVKVKFAVQCGDTSYGDTLKVCGSNDNLGNWDVNKGIVMKTNQNDYPLWRSDPVDFTFPTTSADKAKEKEKISYKYCIVHSDGSCRWEELPMDRELNLVSKKIEAVAGKDKAAFKSKGKAASIKSSDECLTAIKAGNTDSKAKITITKLSDDQPAFVVSDIGFATPTTDLDQVKVMQEDDVQAPPVEAKKEEEAGMAEAEAGPVAAGGKKEKVEEESPKKETVVGGEEKKKKPQEAEKAAGESKVAEEKHEPEKKDVAELKEKEKEAPKPEKAAGDPARESPVKPVGTKTGSPDIALHEAEAAAGGGQATTMTGTTEKIETKGFMEQAAEAIKQPFEKLAGSK